MMRNRTLDRLRAFAMLWTVFIHVLYFGEFFSSSDINALKSWLLLEMPLIFFIMGAGNSLSQEQSYCRFVLKRWSKMMIPYWLYAVVCIVIIMVDKAQTDAITGSVIFETALSWVIPLDRQISHLRYLTWAIWFVPVYLCMVLVMPLMKKMIESEWRFCWAAVLGFVYLVSMILGNDLFQKVAFYALFVYAGHYFQQWQDELDDQPLRGFLWTFVVMTLVVLCGLRYSGVDLDMQFRKFPPDLLFLLFSVGTLSGVLLLTPHLDAFFAFIEQFKPLRFMIDLYAKRSLTIFLYQPIFFLWAVPLVNKWIVGPNFGPELVRVAVCLVMAIPACAFPAWLVGKAEDCFRHPLKTKRQERKYDVSCNDERNE